MPKSHVILIDIHLKNSAQSKKEQRKDTEKTMKILTDQIHTAFGPITSRFSVEWDFTGRFEDFNPMKLCGLNLSTRCVSFDQSLQFSR